MDAWGVEGCREHREEIVAWLRESYAATTWTERLAAGGIAIIDGLAFQLDLSDPFGSLVDEAIRRAAEKAPEGSPDQRPQRRH